MTPRSQESGVRSRHKLTAVAILSLLALSACSGIQRDPPIIVWWDMKRQLKFRTEGETGLFPDGRNTRPIPEDTVVRGSQWEDTPYYTGMDGDKYVGRMPVEITPALLHQGQLRFTTYCTPCHDRTGSGRGTVPTRIAADGIAWQPANLMEDRLVEAADGDLFNVITNGRRTMPSYKYQVVTADRWAIIAYVRLLQRAAHGTMQDVPENMKASIEVK
ncbi:MAG TPA: cytochrome c [Bryobacteraceae bacterium]